MKTHGQSTSKQSGWFFRVGSFTITFFLLFSFLSIPSAQAQEQPPTETPMDVNPLELPDLTFYFWDYPTVIYANDDLHIYAAVTNQSSAAAGPFYIEIDIDGTTACFDYGDYYHDIYTGLGAYADVNLEFVIPEESLSLGAHTFSMYVDTDCEVEESNETNNLLTGSFTVITPPVSAPAHDDFGSARTVTGVPYTDSVDVRGATRASDDPVPSSCGTYPGAASVWYVYTPPVSRSMSFDTFGSNYDTVLSVWTGSRGSLTAVACNDDYDFMGGNFLSAVQVNMTGGMPYYIQVTEFAWTGSANWTAKVIAEASVLEAESRKHGETNTASVKKTVPEVDSQAGGTLVLHATSFADVPGNYWSWGYIERLYAAGITGGCGVGLYCPEATVTRGQMAVFLERGMNSSSYSPPAASGLVFGDVPASYWSAAWVEKLYADGITGGCGGGNYCPEQPVSRAQMAVFLLRAKYGSSYSPPPATGDFADVPTSYWAASWIEQLTAEGITSGCGSGNYCPEQLVSRAQMAVFLVRTFGLP